ncbi:MAG TPA: 3-phosphoshikimate 1-carboxyvinyltransferase [Opitutaceae bacterium]|nr:3-phosphoshikimate 1-carboxyvinyltransferase [Opitutaceae bacterium]
MPLPDILPIPPFTRPVRGEVTLPGSKSLTNRALLLAALCDGPVTLAGALFSEDTRIMAEALRRLGFGVREDAEAATISVQGLGGRIPAEKADLFVGNAGTAARFLTAFCAAAPRGAFRIDGVPQMRQRPIRGLLAALEQQGAEIEWLGQPGFFPFEVRARGLAGGPVKIEAAESSQMLSALLLVGVLARSDLEIEVVGRVRQAFVEMTRRQIAQFGGSCSGIAQDSNRIRVSRGAGRYRAPRGPYRIEPDATAASYFLALPLVAGGQLAIPGLALADQTQTLQGDAEFAQVLAEVGPERRGVDRNFSEFSDTFLTLAAIAPLLRGPTRISGIAHTRKQETDRVAGMARELTRLGQQVEETEDALTIHPRPLKADQVVETYGDHRFAMSFGILGCHDLRGDGKPWLSVKDPACSAKTFPNFFALLESVRQNSLKG